MSKKINGSYLAVETYLFQMKLNPTEILIMAKVAELNRNCEKCFISDETLAENYGVSKSTISRAIKRLSEECGFLIKETKNVKGGKERVLSLNDKKIKEYLSNVNLSVDGEEKQDSQQANCLLTTSKMPIDKKQNELIKENIKENLKDNIGEIEKPTALSISLRENKEEEKPVEKKQQDYLKISKRELDAMGARYELVVGNLGYIIDTGRKIELI